MDQDILALFRVRLEAERIINIHQAFISEWQVEVFVAGYFSKSKVNNMGSTRPKRDIRGSSLSIDREVRPTCGNFSC